MTTIRYSIGGTAHSPAVFPVPPYNRGSFCQLAFARITMRPPYPANSILSAFIEINYANPAQPVTIPLPLVDAIAPAYEDPLVPPVPGSRYIAASRSKSYYPPPAGLFWIKDNIYEWSGAEWLRTVPVAGNAAIVATDGEMYIYGETSPPTWIMRPGILHYNTSAVFNGTIAETNLLQTPQIPPVGNPFLGYVVTIRAPADFSAQIAVKYT